jgi:hypothetical protein
MRSPVGNIIAPPASKQSMKGTPHLAALVLLLVICNPSLGMISVENLTRDRAKELGIELKAKANGPREAWIELEFKPEGQLKEFQHVSLEIRDGDQFLLGWTPLEAKPTGTGSVVVRVMANRAFLGKVTLRIVTGATDDVGRDLRIRDFVDLEKLP